jgi:23S rRNA pseudouridine1911/1915/1917 synthase
MLKIIIEESDLGTRLDKIISMKLPNISRSLAQSLISQGSVKLYDNSQIDGASSKGILINSASYNKLKLGQLVSLELADKFEQPNEILPDQNIKLDIIYEDEDILVINKQAGLIVHPTDSHYENSLVNGLLAYCGRENLSSLGEDFRPGIVHRLDKDTTGLMVIAKNNHSHQVLADQITAREMKRSYQAIVWGVPKPESGTIDVNIDRSPKDNSQMVAVRLRDRGKIAITHYETKEILLNSVLSYVECKLETGRTNQIRVHMSHIGNSVLGDPKYGHNERKIRKLGSNYSFLYEYKSQLLHSFSLELFHPRSGDYLSFQVKSQEIESFINLCKNLRKEN